MNAQNLGLFAALVYPPCGGTIFVAPLLLRDTANVAFGGPMPSVKKTNPDLVVARRILAAITEMDWRLRSDFWYWPL